MNDFTYIVLLDFLPIITLIVYGIKFRFKTPAFGDNSGINTPYTTQSQKAWAYAHNFGGTLCLIFAAISAVAIVTKYSIYGQMAPVAIEFSVIAVQLIFVFSFFPITNLRVKALFGAPANAKKKKK